MIRSSRKLVKTKNVFIAGPLLPGMDLVEAKRVFSVRRSKDFDLAFLSSG